MDTSANSTDSPPQRAPSSEPGSTRPNPFDDSDVASRKRRRTSGSGDSLNQIRDQSSLSPAIDNEASPASDQVMTMDQPPTPRTPEEPSNGTSRAEPPSSSKVTINLRRTASGQDRESLPPRLPDRFDPDVDNRVAVDRATDREDDIRPRREESPTTPSSPPIELVQDDKDDAFALHNTIEDISLGGHNIGMSDPVLSFPYKDPSELPHEVVDRLVTFLSTPINDTKVLVDVGNWLQEYIYYLENGREEIRDLSLSSHDNFFMALSKTLSAMIHRRPPLHRIERLRETILDYYINIILLTKYLVVRDLALVHETQALLLAGEKRLPVLLAPYFLDHIGALVQTECDYEDADEADEMDDDTPADRFSDRLEHMFGEGLNNICDLMGSLLEIVSNFPVLLEGLAISTASLAALVRSATKRHFAAQQQDAVIKRRATKYLSTSHELWPSIAACLYKLIDKNVTQIDKGSLLQLIDRLEYLLKLWARYPLGTELLDVRLQDFADRYPQVPAIFVPEAVSLEWKFDQLSRLIRCSQMQLRVAGASSMCSTLVNMWKRYEEEPRNPVLQHVAGYLNRSSIIEYILGANSHPAIMNESANIVGFLAVTKTYEQRHTDQLWRAFASCQDPRAADALVRLIMGITNLLDMSSLGDLCAKLDDRPFSEFTPTVRNLFDTIMKRIFEKSAREQPLTYQPYGLCLRLLRESTLVAQETRTAIPEMHQVLMQRLRDLIRIGPGNHRAALYLDCLKDISLTSSTTLGSLWCLSNTVTVQNAIAHEMDSLIREHDFARLLVEEIEHAVNSRSASRADPVLCGVVNKPRYDFLLQILRHQSSSMGDGLGEKLWDLLVGSNCPNSEDREAGWRILNQIRGDAKNPYIRSCYSSFLPNLPAEHFCEGTLRFVSEEIKYLEETGELHLDDEASLRSSCVEQLWRLVLEAPDGDLAKLGIPVLAAEIYIKSVTVNAYPLPRARQVHSTFVNRCLSHLKESASYIRSPQDDEVMIVDGGDEKQERIFIRSLQLLTHLLTAHSGSPRFSVPDLRPFISQDPAEIAGDPLQLKYQSFDGSEQTGIKTLQIGKLNTAASLLASIRQETGFPNYRAFWAGGEFPSSAQDVCKSLEDLCIRDGLFLVKREEGDSSGPYKCKPGCSALQGEILSHFQEMAQYLDLKGTLAAEVFEFLCRLPADHSVIEALEDPSKSHIDIFPHDRPYRCLYTAHALSEYMGIAFASAKSSSDSNVSAQQRLVNTRRRIILLLLEAIQDELLVPLKGTKLELDLATRLMHALSRWHLGPPSRHASIDDAELRIHSPEKFISILSMSLSSSVKQAEGLTMQVFPVLITLAHYDRKLWDSLRSSTSFRRLVSQLILHDPRQQLRLLAFQTIGGLCDLEMKADPFPHDLDAQCPMSRWMWALGMQLLQDVIALPSHCTELVNMMLSLTANLLQVRRDAVDLHALVEVASDLLLSHETTEDIDQAAPFDPIPLGLTLILLKCLQNDESIAQSPTLRRDIVWDIFWRHLFPQTRSGWNSRVPRVVLNSETRWKVSELLLLLSKHDREHYATLLQCLNEMLPFVDEDDDHYLYEIPGNFDRAKALRAPCGYAGLRNLSNTCYLNSLLTQLYMNTGFREFMMGARLEYPDDKQILLKETKKVFGFLQESYRRFIDPEDFVSAIQQYDGGPIDIHNQMDVDEFYNLLFDRMEAQLLESDAKKHFRKFYGGQLVQQIKSRECEHISERLESFSAIQLDIKGKSCLQESLQTYIEGEVLEGDNKYKCSTCDNHVDAVKRACLKDLPDNVIFHLKRFDFNLFTLQRSKINDYFAFPERIDLTPYTVEHLSDPTSQDEDVFELVGVLVHAGTSETGHYYSYIRERPSSAEQSRWFEFNDDVVTAWDPANMESAAFGGPDHRPPPFDANGNVYDKSYSAYMLFYERASKLRRQEQQIATSEKPVPVCVAMESKRRSFLWDENTNILRRHCLFDPTHFSLVKGAFELLPDVQAAPISSGSPSAPGNDTNNGPSEDGSQTEVTEISPQDSQGSPATVGLEEPTSPHDRSESRVVAKNMTSETLQDLAMEVVLSHLDQAVSHKKDIPEFTPFMEMIDKATSQSVEAAHAYYRYFYLRPAAFRSMLQRNSEPTVRLGIGKQFLEVLHKIATDAPQHYTLSQALPQRPIGVPVLNGVMHILKHLWSNFHVSIRSWDEYFGFILGFAQMGDLEVAQLLSEDYVLKLCYIVAADRSLDLSQQYERLLTFIERRSTGNRPPSYREMLSVLNHLLLQLDPKIDPEASVENATDRLSQQPPFSWSTSEFLLMLDRSEGANHSFFIEKLLRLEERPNFIGPVAMRLIQANWQLDRSVAPVLIKTTYPAAASKTLEANLQLSAIYLAVTTQPNTAEQLISHIAGQAKGFDPADMPALVEFFHTVLRLDRDDADLAEQLHFHTLALAPYWAPVMLVQLNMHRRRQAIDILDDHLFESPVLRYPLDHNFGDEEEAQRQFEDMVDIVKRLGIGCLQFLRDVHVLGHRDIGRGAAETITGVIKKCKQYFEGDAENTLDRMQMDFIGLQEETVEPLRQLIVDYVDDDGTDWDASSRSDQMDGVATEMNLQAMNDLNDPDGN